MNIRTMIFAAIGSAAMLSGGIAFADTNNNSPPEPYSAPDPVYAPHQVQSDVTMQQRKDQAVLTDPALTIGTAAGSK